jgi:hypothetical protein
MQARDSYFTLDNLQGHSKVAINAVDGLLGADGDQFFGVLSA